MSNDKEPYKNLFDLLDELAQLNQHDLENRFSEDLVDAIRLVAKELIDTWQPIMNSRKKFAETVYYLRKFKKAWSNKLGEALIVSMEHYEKGNKDEAVKILDEFIKECPSSFYITNAQARKERYISGKLKVLSENAKMWGRKAGNVIADAIESRNSGENEKAIAILEDFIKACPIESYKKDAESLRDEIKSKNNT